MTFQQTNQEFIKNMLIKVWFKDDEKMPILVDQTLNIFNDWIETEIIKSLSDQQMESFDKFISWDVSDEEIYNFFNSNISNFDKFMDWLYGSFEKMYISEYKKALNK